MSKKTRAKHKLNKLINIITQKNGFDIKEYTEFIHTDLSRILRARFSTSKFFKWCMQHCSNPKIMTKLHSTTEKFFCSFGNFYLFIGSVWYRCDIVIGSSPIRELFHIDPNYYPNTWQNIIDAEILRFHPSHTSESQYICEETILTDPANNNLYYDINPYKMPIDNNPQYFLLLSCCKPEPDNLLGRLPREILHQIYLFTWPHTWRDRRSRY
jgi:hypothetical protein